MSDIVSELRSHFRRLYSEEPIVVRAPGRVNLIGEHTDYNGGFVMPAAIEFSTWAAASARTDGRLVARSLQYPEVLDADLRSDRPRAKDWTDYCWGVAASLLAEGQNIYGANVLVSGNVPMGAGLSSSASIEVAVAVALCETSGIHLPLPRVAKICQRAENEFVGARCGIMDQFVSCMGKAGHAVMLDCRSLEFQHAPLPEGLSLVVCNTMVKHSIAAGQYNQRRAECEEGVRLIATRFPDVRELRDVSPARLKEVEHLLPPVILKRCRHIAGEDERVLAAASAMGAGDLSRLGELMYESHRSLRDDYEVSCPELDIMVELARRQRGTVGARMTGGGFGGCTVNLVESGAVESFRAAVANGYRGQTGTEPEIYVTRASDGVHVVG
jgi:galactokinase